MIEHPTRSAISEAQVVTQLRTVMTEWTVRINKQDTAWFDGLLSHDFTYTSHPHFPLVMKKGVFLDLLKNVSDQVMEIRDVRAQVVGNIAIVTIVAKCLAESFRANLGPGFPSPEEIEKSLLGRSVVYGFGWRILETGWQLFDQHLYEIVD